MANKRKRLGMVIDLDRCIGCWTCAVVCKEENNVPLGLWWARILTVGGDHIDVPEGEFPAVRMNYMPINCFHCDNPPCVQVCPVGATYKREDGIVMMDYDKCIGCRYCMVACPYNNRTFNWQSPEQVPANEDGYHVGAVEKPPRPRGVVEKCDLCYHRVDEGLQPVCVEGCPAEARVFGDLNDPESEVSQMVRTGDVIRIREDLGTKPSVYYRPPRSVRRSNGLEADLTGSEVASEEAWDGRQPSVDEAAVAKAKK